MKNILLALDIQHFDPNLVTYTCEIAKALKAKIWTLHVMPDPDLFIGYEEGPEYIRVNLAHEIRDDRRFLQGLAALVREQEVEAEAMLVSGDLVQSILSQAERLSVHLIVTGVNDHGFLTNALGGNTALEIIKRTEIPVLCFPLTYGKK